MKIMQKWKNMTSKTKKRFVFIFAVLILILGIGGFYAVRAIVKDPYAKYASVYRELEGQYERQDFFLEVGESVYFDVNSQLENIEFNIKKIETHVQDVYYKNNILTAKHSGTSGSIGVTLYNGDEKTKHYITIARVCGRSAENAIEIRTAQDLVSINENLAGKYLLKDNIDLADFGEWTPIGGDERKPFTGTLINPEGFKIKNLRITSDIFYAGLFYEIKGYGYVDGLILENVLIDSSNSSNNYLAGGIAAFLDTSGVIHNCEVQGTVTAQRNAGGIVGEMRDSVVVNCVFIGNVNAPHDNSIAGGIVAYVYGDISIIDCIVVGDVASGGLAEGIVGLVSHSSPISLRGIKNNRFIGELLNAGNRD